MELIVNKYDNSGKMIELIGKRKEDLLCDVVVAFELGFVSDINNHQFFNSHLFCFHYLVDIYKEKPNVSFDILATHEETDNYFFDKIRSNFYKPAKSKKIDVEKGLITVPKVDLGFEVMNNEYIGSIVEKIKMNIWETHESILDKFKKSNITYEEFEMNLFSLELKKFIEKSYDSIEHSELKPFVKQYEAISLSSNLSTKEIKAKKVKI